ncbi:histone H3.v1-like [Cotesia glomerata]|uniref:histone H3.v1-like n=1 Tax=Cotesia glomerata TaxID=32391 RepID=UPI001D0333AB|nr:histone H3.v1-like [Cotesia glomerata]
MKGATEVIFVPPQLLALTQRVLCLVPSVCLNIAQCHSADDDNADACDDINDDDDSDNQQILIIALVLSLTTMMARQIKEREETVPEEWSLESAVTHSEEEEEEEAEDKDEEEEEEEEEREREREEELEDTKEHTRSRDFRLKSLRKIIAGGGGIVLLIK